jgi:hypothetical protein
MIPLSLIRRAMVNKFKLPDPVSREKSARTLETPPAGLRGKRRRSFPEGTCSLPGFPMICWKPRSAGRTGSGFSWTGMEFFSGNFSRENSPP